MSKLFEPINQWIPAVGDNPLIIAGPCGAESLEQMVKTAEGLAALGKVHVFRTGIWKPRTRPNSFEGAGAIGLTWLKEVKNQFGFKTAVEVANASHVEEALKQDVDIVWIGARTTVNPFSVQEIATALQGSKVGVMVKNPIHADLQLWIGAIERLLKADCHQLIAIHRGFYSYAKTIYRNTPLWEIPIGLKTTFPDLPIVCDPSHICGNRELQPLIAQKAYDLKFDGLMIESHWDPDAALSDKNQQFTPDALGELLSNLRVRSNWCGDIDFRNNLDQLREEVDRVDEEILLFLSKRMDLIKAIGQYKKDNNVSVLQLERWKKILNTRIESGDKKALDKDFVEELYKVIHRESIKVQTEIMNQNN